jgi:hypothetical protein
MPDTKKLHDDLDDFVYLVQKGPGLSAEANFHFQHVLAWLKSLIYQVEQNAKETKEKK